MIYYLLTVILCTLLFIQISIFNFTEAPSVKFEGYYDLVAKKELPENFKSSRRFNGVIFDSALAGPSLLKTAVPAPVSGTLPGLTPAPVSPSPSLSQPRGRSIRLPGTRDIVLPPDALAAIPFLGFGYFRYAKVGSEVFFHGRSGELLWKRPLHSYPVSDYYGELILLLTGDGNRVDLLDRNGNSAGPGSVSGNFLSDYDFAARRSAAALVFGAGKLYVVDNKGQMIMRYTHEAAGKEDILFFKSVALGPRANRAAIHYRRGKKDRLIILENNDGETVEIGEATLPRVYPHVLHFAVNDGGVLLTAPDFTAFYDSDGDEVWKRPTPLKSEGIYRAVYAGRDFFVFGEKRRGVQVGDAWRIILTDSGGRSVTRWPMKTKSPWRILPGKKTGEFVVHTAEGLRFLKYRASRGEELAEAKK